MFEFFILPCKHKSQREGDEDLNNGYGKGILISPSPILQYVPFLLFFSLNASI
jgi:hypothetical protein